MTKLHLLEALVRDVLERGERGLAAELCRHTEIMASELSHWRRGERGLTDTKLIQAVEFLIQRGTVRVEVVL